MPVSIPPFSNVPAPNDGVQSAWAQQLTQYAVDHLNDTVDAHDASAISFVPTGTIAATNVQAAIAEVAAEGLIASAWTNVTFQNSWVNAGAPSQTVQYRKIGDDVQLRGIAKNGSMSVTMLQLPVGFRPPANNQFSVVSLAAYGAVTVGSDGNVTPTVGNNGLFSLSGIQFSVTA